MIKRYLLIRDNEKEFAARLINRLNDLYGEVDILVIYEDEAAEFGEDELFIFSDERSDDDNKIYKFQKAADIRREIYAKSGGYEALPTGRKTGIIILVTPSGNANQRRYMYEEAVRRGEKESVLLINVGFFCENKSEVGAIGLSELCFELYKGLGSSIDKPYIDKAIYTENGIDILRPFSSPVHLMQLKGELAELINIIEKACKYDELFISVETLFPRIDELMARAAEVIILKASAEEETEDVALTGLREYILHAGTAIERIKERTISCLITEN